MLGVDNVIFISILSGKLPPEQQQRARRVGLLGRDADAHRCCCSRSRGSSRLTEPLFTVVGREISGRDLILIGGGLFLLGKATYEIHDKLEGRGGPRLGARGAVFAASSCRSCCSTSCSRSTR